MKDLFRLDGKVAVVIGGAGGIGQGIAEAMAFYGAEVVIASRKMESLVRAKSEIKEKVGKDVAIYTVDATNEDSIIALVNTVVSNHKKADILVNAQGYNKKFSLFDFPMDVMADMMNVNVIGVAMACKHFGKVMKENGYGRIINLSSVRGVRAFSGGGGNMGYCTSKGAVDMLTRTLAAELGPEVTVNAIGPTLTVTPMMAEVIKEHPETLNLGNGKPLERIGKVEDCMGPAVFLASEAGAFVTGQIPTAASPRSADGGEADMVSILFKPTLHQFATCREFVEDFKLSSQDLILTNQYIYQPYFGQMGLGCQILFQEQYGAGEPSDVMVDAILAAAAKTDCKRIVAIGGGTVIDIAKVLAVAGSEGVDALYDKAPDLEKKRELVIVPTTCGTGSEVTNISIMARTRMGTKLGLVSPAMYADQAVLIPELLEGLPFGVFATSSIDALVHAVESSLSPKATPYTKLFGYKAIEMLIRGYQRIAMDGQESRIGLLEDFLLASNYAGLAFGTAGCAAVHATSYPLGGKYHVPHGESNYAMFTGVLKNYMELRQDGEIAVLNRYLADLLGCGVPVVYDKLEELLNQILPKKPLHAYGMTREDIDEFAHSVITSQGRLMANNFVPLDEERVRKIYRELY